MEELRIHVVLVLEALEYAPGENDVFVNKCIQT